jgi:hypothetical protein
MNSNLMIEVSLPEDVHAKVQLLANEHAVRVEDFVIELIRERIPDQEVTCKAITEELLS